MISGFIFWKNSFLNALSFLTVIKVHPRGDFSTAVHSFATIGLFIGAGLAACSLTGVASPVIMLAYLALITRLLHIDGLSDTFDGLLSNKDKPQMLEIMRDSRVGAMGAAAIALCFIGKFYSFALIDSIWLLIIIPAGARFTMAMLVYFTPYARPEGLGKIFSSISFKNGFIQAIPVIALSVFWLDYIKTGILLGVFIIVYIVVRMWYMHAIGGITGDMAGAICEIAETSAFLVAGTFPA